MRATGILTSVLGCERPDIVGNAKRDEAFELVRIFREEGVKATLVFNDAGQLFEMELVVDGAVVARLEPAEELLPLETGHHVGIVLVALGAGLPKEALDFLLQPVVIEFVQVVGSVALRLVARVIA